MPEQEQKQVQEQECKWQSRQGHLGERKNRGRKMKSINDIAPYLVLMTTAFLAGCAPLNREVLHETKNDRPAAAPTSVGPTATARTERIWFVREKNGNLESAAVDRKVNEHEPVRDSVTQLLQGPTKEEAESGFKSEVPVGTVLIGVDKKGDSIELNLSKRFASGGVDSIEARLDQLSKTVKDAAGPTKVYLDVEGQRLLTAGEGLEVKQPLN
jgi:spore germination protein GerM